MHVRPWVDLSPQFQEFSVTLFAAFSSARSSRVRRAAAAVAATSAVLSFGAVLGTATATAAPVTCVSPPSANDIRIDGTASCGAKATAPGVARSDANDSGTAVSVADGGAANATATGFGTALSAVSGAGNSYAFALGGGISRSAASNGATAIAVAGYGGGASASTETGVNCAGLNSFALDLSTGRACIAGF
nr:DUF6764 family protein [Rhodococcus corynebacterioides]